ncbi:MAG: glycosyltransferase family 9 protein [Spirochaetes bacterium]|nr:glycosyltransferase family 9 protein [Spirochaetota bacterium]
MNYIIFQTAFIGDIILSTSMISTIMEVDPESKIIFITTPAGETILKNDIRIKILVYDKRGKDKGFTGLIKLRAKIRKILENKNAVYISPHRYVRASVLGFLLKGKRRAGFENSALSFLYNRKIKYRTGIHETERNFELLRTVFGSKLSGMTPAAPVLFPSDEDLSRAKYLTEPVINKYKKIVCIAPGSVWETKRWPAEYFSELIHMLAEQRTGIILIGGEEDRKLCDSLAVKGVKNLAGELSILESSAVISMTRVLVCNDSAPLHMASAMKTPAVAIFGATTMALGFGPLSAGSVVIENNTLQCRPCGKHGGRKCPENHFECMVGIKPERVFQAVIKIIS